MASLFPLLWNRSLRSAPLSWLNASGGELVPVARRAGPLPVSLRAISSERPLRVELLDWEAARRRADDWSELVESSLESNVFLEPAFTLTSAQHCSPAHRPVFLCVSDLSRGGQNGRLIGLSALEWKHRGFGAIARGWNSKLGALGTPLLDLVHGAEAFDLMLDWFTRNSRRTAGLLLPAIPAAGPTARLIAARALALNLHQRTFDDHFRAVLPAGGDIDAIWRETIRRKRMKELRRQRRRLDDSGQLTWGSARGPGDVRVAFERFMALEARGWKGDQGSALLCDPGVATFARTMTRVLAREGKCRIDSLDLDGEPVAMGITLISGKSAALWKIAYDEDFAGLSPGVQFTLEYTRRQLAEDSINFTDSCAIADHPMIDKIWPERMPMVDIFTAVSPEQSTAFHASAWREDMRRRARRFAKNAYHALLRRRHAHTFTRPPPPP